MAERKASWRRRLEGLRPVARVLLAFGCAVVVAGVANDGCHVRAQSPAARVAPSLDVCFPVGVQRGHVARWTLSGSGLGDVPRVRVSYSVEEAAVEGSGGIPSADGTSALRSVMPGFYELWVESPGGVSNPRTVVVSDVTEVIEVEGNATLDTAMPVTLDCGVNGRMDAAGDQDHFRFHAESGQLVVLECLAERIDSRMRAVLELYDARGRRLAVNRGFYGTEPLIAFRVPETGDYVVRVQDLVLGGGPDHVYRLEIDTRPRVVCCHPAVVRAGEATRVTVFGWNLGGDAVPAQQSPDPGATTRGCQLEQRTITLEGAATQSSQSPVTAAPVSLRLDARQVEWQGVAWHYPNSVRSIPLATTDIPVHVVPAPASSGNASTATRDPVPLDVPGEWAGQLLGADDHWFSLTARRGEVFHVEAWGQRIGSPVDLQVAVCADEERRTTLHGFPPRESPWPARDAAPTDVTLETSDPAGRWVAPRDGRYLLLVRDLSQGVDRDPRRVYRLSVRREEAESAAVVVTRRDELSTLVLGAGGREVLDVWAVRRRGSHAGLRVRALEVPAGVECPDIWIAPHATHGTLVISAANELAEKVTQGTLRLQMEAADGTEGSLVRSGTRVRAGRPAAWGRIASQFHVAVRGREPYRLTLLHDPAVDHHLYGPLRLVASPGSMLDLFVRLDREANAAPAAVRLVGEGLPDSVRNESTMLPAGSPGTFVSFYLPPTLLPGSYSWIVRGEIEQRLADGKVETRTLFSNPVTIEVVAAAFQVSTDPLAVTRARRGETIVVRYQAQRLPGFIGKMHTELAVAGKVTDVPGLLSRGETFVGQTEQGSLQIIVQPDAPLGRVPALRLLTVGVVEDEPRYYGSSPVNLEVVE